MCKRPVLGQTTVLGEGHLDDPSVGCMVEVGRATWSRRVSAYMVTGVVFIAATSWGERMDSKQKKRPTSQR